MKKVILFLIVLSAHFSIVAQDDHSDCGNALMICSYDAIAIEELPGAGNTQELNDISCSALNGNETNSVWFKWKIEEAGNIGFTIIPVDGNSDIDFVLYRLNDELDNCDAKEEIRCMASGQNRGLKTDSQKYNCLGTTGLSDISKDNTEMPGCSEGDDNFVSMVNAGKGDSYALVINNYYSAKGFIIEFTGSATFESGTKDCTSDDGQSVFIQDVSESKLVFGELYPNPAYEIITLDIKNNTSITYKNARCLLVSTKGQILMDKEFNIGVGEVEINMPLDEVPKGIYFIKTEIGENVHVARFAKL